MLPLSLIRIIVMLTVTMVTVNRPVSSEHNSGILTTYTTPEIHQVYPASGPVNGGTLLTISGNHLGNVNDSIFVDIGGVRCSRVRVLTPYTNLTCVLGYSNDYQTKGILVLVSGSNYSDSNTYFTFKEPKLIHFRPGKGILSGNTTILISGVDIGFEGQNRYTITLCDDVFRIECSESQIISSSDHSLIKCQTGKSIEPRNMTQLEVVIDELTMLTLNAPFQYLPDPTFNLSTKVPKSLQSGGAIFTIYGKGFNNVWEITVERVDKSCDVPDDTFAVCETPPRLQNQSNNQTIDVHFDGLTIQVTLEYVNEPAFQKFQAVLEYDKESTIIIQGRHILSIALREDYHIDIGLDGTCLIVDISMDLITCVPPKSVPMTNNTDVLIVHVIVNVIGKHIYIGDIKYITETNTLAIVVWILGAGLVGFVIICLSVVTILRRKKTKAANEFKIEIKAKKEIVQRYGREGVPERRRNVRSADEKEYTEPDESIYDEVNIEEENNTRENSYLDVHDGYDELGQRSPITLIQCE